MNGFRAARALALTATLLLVGVVAPAAAGATAPPPLTWASPNPIDAHLSTSVGADLTAVSCPDSSLCVAVDAGGDAQVYSGGGWSAPHRIEAAGALTGVSCPSATDCVAVSSNGDILTTGDPAASTWTVTHPTPAHSFVALSCPTAAFCAAADTGGFVTTTSDGGKTWSTTSAKVDTGAPPTAISCAVGASSTLCALVDADNTILTSTTPASVPWTAAATGGAMSDVSCATVNLCVAVDDRGQAIVNQNASSTLGSWSSPQIDTAGGFGAEGLDGVSCTAAPLCVAVDQNGNAITSAGNLSTWSTVRVDDDGGVGGLTAVSCSPDGRLCAAVDDSGHAAVSTDSAATWAQQTLNPNATVTDSGGGVLIGVTCASQSLCLAVDASGHVLASSDPWSAGVGWAPQVVDRYRAIAGFPPGAPGAGTFEGITCASTALCAAYDTVGKIFTTTDPQDVSHARWSRAATIDAAIAGMSCPATNLCVAVNALGSVITSTDPTGGSSTWKAASVDLLGGGFTGISCPSTTLCVATDLSGGVLWTTDPAAPAATWQRSPQQVDTLFGVSCPSASLCVAVDDEGDVLTSTDPAHGTWVKTSVSATFSATSISCPSASWCLAGGAGGEVMFTTDPTGDATAWTTQAAEPVTPGASLSAAGFIWGVACAAPRLCLAVAWDGNLMATEQAPITPAAPVTTSSPTPTGGVAGSTTTTKPASQPHHRLTRAQKLARALRACAKIRHKKQRARCISRAHKRFGPARMTRAQKLTRAIVACLKIKNGARRRRCVTAAHRRYDPVRHRRSHRRHRR